MGAYSFSTCPSPLHFENATPCVSLFYGNAVFLNPVECPVLPIYVELLHIFILENNPWKYYSTVEPDCVNVLLTDDGTLK
jgi:hypothetical protein